MTTQPIQVFGYFSGCPACDELKQLLDLLSIQYDYFPISKTASSRRMLDKMNIKTLPQVFSADGVPLGDYSSYRRSARLGILEAGLVR